MPQPQESNQLTEEQEREAARLGAAYLLGHRRMAHKELVRAEAQARLGLAAAIIAMDQVKERIAAGEKIHSLNEQAAVELTKNAYAQALADLLRGEAPEQSRR